MTGNKNRNVIIRKETGGQMNINDDVNVVIYGAGGHANVVADLVVSTQKILCGFFDDEAGEGNATVQQYGTHLFKEARMIIGIGNNTVRQRIAYSVKHAFISLVHPAACVVDSVKRGEGTVVLANAVIQANAVIGKHVIINAGVVIDHDAVIEDFVHIAPNAYIGGSAHIEKGAVVGAGAVISRFAKVKANTVVPPLTVV
ncbi:acetyltransferase EpsM [Chitinophaga niastensis]|uniref:Acetyltransferase EpsM n=1 Tax=Chitinophaga niastensis TaxID=536980 RepID=A0A2P8HFB8_CHINA|nr:hypothetical protein [Chitinophaga niastensis]PSL44907.1 acetyltransferase EpsM [Chitinophaga niastensis]